MDAVRGIQISSATQEKHHPVLQQASDFPSGFLDTSALSKPSACSNIYRGESSLDAQVRWATNSQDPSNNQRLDASTIGAPFGIQNILNWQSTSPQGSWSSLTHGPAPLLHEYPRLARCSLPPSDAVLRLLRLAQTEKQRFFVDVDLFDEQHFADMCRSVFFAVNPYSIWLWSSVNIGLFYLFSALKSHRHAEIGLSTQQVDQITESLAVNIQAALGSFQICDDPSLESCQALALSVSTFRSKMPLWNPAFN